MLTGACVFELCRRDLMARLYRQEMQTFGLSYVVLCVYGDFMRVRFIESQVFGEQV